MEKTKVIEFIQSMGDGGAETLVKDYALLMDKERFEILVVVQHAVENSANLQHLRNHGIPLIALSDEDDVLKKIWRKLFWKKTEDIKSEEVQERHVLPGENYEEVSKLRMVRNHVRNLYFGLKLLRIVRRTGATVIHAHLDMLGCLQAVSSSLKGIRLFHTCHSLPELIYAGEEGNAARHLIRKNNLQLLALHEGMAAQMDELFPEQKTKVIHNGINMDRFKNPSVSGREKREELNIPQNAFVVGHVGRFTPEKNHAFLVEVFREICSKRKDAYLLMVGAGDTCSIESQLQRYKLEDRSQILSHRRDIPELLAAMDVFVFPSVFEGFPVSVIEAQAVGLRCAISDQCPKPVVCTPACIPMPLGEPEKWAEMVLSQTENLQFEAVLGDYDMDTVIRGLEKLYISQEK